MRWNSKYKIGLLVVLICSISFTTRLIAIEQVSAILENQQKSYTAGDRIILGFRLSQSVNTQLFLHSSFGSVLLDSDTGSFTLPDFISKKKGVLTYQLFYNSKVIYDGVIKIIANRSTPVRLETYIGPPSILVGGEDYTMQVVIPTDLYDNPLSDSTAIDTRYQFLENEKEKRVYTSDMIGWHRIYSDDKAGRLLIASNVKKKTSKEFSVEMLPGLPSDFRIYSSRNHKYADGNQITTFTTSVLKDAYNNVVSNGTRVDFSIKSKNENVLHTQGSTVNGVATAKILAPDYQVVWQVKAYVSGMAESNVLNLEYKPAIDNLEVNFAKKNREIRIGPLLSFMGQLIPDGAIVSIEISKQGAFIDKKILTSSYGEVIFRLEEGFYPSGDYDLKIQSMGLQKEFKSIILQ
ncbi:hypothetical protein AB832_02465 [Flavobacteriaceae bacterium (ex Bugula neritina AB1)]|nr:hypothetical protein AB832_02465 [Flavobacteriaceae bacterium (ex Bugula neritina AB1)]